MKRYFSTLRAIFSKPCNRGVASRKNRRVRLEVECLEQREVMTAAPFASGGILVPAYFDPSTTAGAAAWANLDTAAKSVGVEAIMNPASGPGTGPNASYTAAVQSLHNAGGKVIGYVPSWYDDYQLAAAHGVTFDGALVSSNAQLQSLVEQEIADYHSWYKVDGIFIDQMDNTYYNSLSTDLSFYQAIYNYAHSLGYTVVGNPGWSFPQSYLTTPVADTFVGFEDPASYSGGTYSTFQPPSWQANYSPSHFANIIYGVSTVAAMQADVTQAAAQNNGWVYVTDQQGSNPYAQLPTYWSQLVAAVALPAAPAFTVKAASSTEITLSWSSVANATGYTVDEKVNGVWTPIATLGPTATSYSAMNLTAGTSYSFMVGASDGGGTTFASAQTVATLAAVTAPAAPVFTASAASSTQINLSWSPVAGATSYTFDKLVGTVWTPIDTLSSTTYSATGLTASTYYEFKVGATNAAGTNFANPQTVSTLAKVTPPAAPVLSFVNVSSTEVELSWVAVPGATSYTVYEYKFDSGSWQPIATLTSSTSILVNSTGDNSFYVTATNSAGTSSSNQVFPWL